MKKAILASTSSIAMKELIGFPILVSVKPKLGHPFEFGWYDEENHGMQIAMTASVVAVSFNGPVTHFVTESGSEYIITLTR